MGGGAGPAEHVRDDQVGPAVREPAEPFTGVGRADPDARLGVQREVVADELDERRVEFHDLLGGAGSGGGGVAGEGERAASQVQHAQGLERGRREVDDVADAALVGEREVCGVVEVHVGLRGAVDQEGPAVRPFPVGYELREPAAHRPRDRFALGPAAAPAPLRRRVRGLGRRLALGRGLVPARPSSTCHVRWSLLVGARGAGFAEAFGRSAHYGLSSSCRPPRSSGRPGRGRRGARPDR